MLGNEIAAYLSVFKSSQVKIGRETGASRSRVNNVVHYKSANPRIRACIAGKFKMPAGDVFNGKRCSNDEVLHLNEIVTQSF